jgi:hypothetical protein
MSLNDVHYLKCINDSNIISVDFLNNDYQINVKSDINDNERKIKITFLTLTKGDRRESQIDFYYDLINQKIVYQYIELSHDVNDSTGMPYIYAVDMNRNNFCEFGTECEYKVYAQRINLSVKDVLLLITTHQRSNSLLEQIKTILTNYNIDKSYFDFIDNIYIDKVLKKS